MAVLNSKTNNLLTPLLKFHLCIAVSPSSLVFNQLLMFHSSTAASPKYCTQVPSVCWGSTCLLWSFYPKTKVSVCIGVHAGNYSLTGIGLLVGYACLVWSRTITASDYFWNWVSWPWTSNDAWNSHEPDRNEIMVGGQLMPETCRILCFVDVPLARPL